MKYGVVTGEFVSRDGLDAKEPTRVATAGSVKLTPVVTGGGASLDHPITLPLVEGRVKPRWVAVGTYSVRGELEFGYIHPYVIQVTESHTMSSPLDISAARPVDGPANVVRTLEVPASVSNGQVLKMSDGGIVGANVVGYDPGRSTYEALVGSGDDITRSLQEAVSTRSLVIIPEGTWKSSSVTLTPGVTIRGMSHNSVLKATNLQGRAVFLGTSGKIADNVTIENLTLDLGGESANAIQITGARNVVIRNVVIKNAGKAGIVAQGYGSYPGCEDFTVENCVIDGTGLDDGTTGFGVLIKDGSPRSRIVNNRIRNVKGGMGIGGNATNLGAPTHMSIVGNTVETVESTTAFEAIGITKRCDYSTIQGNVIPNSFDNGISVSAGYCTVVGNTISNAWNHGIACEATHTTITANVITNIGRQNEAKSENLEYGFVTLQDSSHCAVVGNTGDSSAHFGVKYNGSYSGGNTISSNAWSPKKETNGGL